LFHRGRAAALRDYRVLKQDGGDTDHVRLAYNGREARVTLAAGHELDVWRPGDRVRLPPGPEGQRGSRKLKKVFQERGIPGPIRRRVPLVRARDSGYVVRLCLGLWEDRDLVFPE
jgi:tRNA(Ile)-lysidine synthetase-like protein